MKLEPVSVAHEKLKALLAKSGRSLRAVAEAAGMDAGHLSNIQNGKKHLDLFKMARLSQALGAYPSDMLPDSWIRAETKAGEERMKKIIESVFGVYLQIRDEHKTEFATPRQLAEIIWVLIEDEKMNITPEEITRTIRVWGKVSPQMKL